jgi:hypothetical protein
MEFVSSFLSPLIKFIFLAGFIGTIAFFITWGVYNAWSKEWKFILKYKIRKKPFDEETMGWCIDAVEDGLDYYDVKKHLMINDVRKNILNETLWIYNMILSELHNSKGGGNNGRKFKRCYSKNEKQSAKLPNFKN